MLQIYRHNSWIPNWLLGLFHITIPFLCVFIFCHQNINTSYFLCCFLKWLERYLIRCFIDYIHFQSVLYCTTIYFCIVRWLYIKHLNLSFIIKIVDWFSIYFFKRKCKQIPNWIVMFSHHYLKIKNILEHFASNVFGFEYFHFNHTSHSKNWVCKILINCATQILGNHTTMSWCYGVQFNYSAFGNIRTTLFLE